MNLAPLFALLAAGAFAAPTPMVTGNGYGDAVFSLSSGTISNLYAHPYGFTRADPRDPLSEGVPTTDFLKSLRWDEPAVSTGAYVEQTHVIAAGRQVFFMPFGLHRNALVAVLRPEAGKAAPACLRVDWAHPVASRLPRRAEGREEWELSFKDIPERLALIALDRGVAASQPEECYGGHAAWALVPLESERELATASLEVARWRGGLAPAELVQRELADFEAWRVKPAVTFHDEAERRVWRQSEAVLRMGQSREPNTAQRHGHGLIVGVLPPNLWFTPWVRDMSYAAAALARMGHEQEARWALEAYFNARPIGRMQAQAGGLPYQISVARYFGDGAEEPYFTLENDTNVELDGWGLVLWVMGAYVQRSGDLSLLRQRTYRGSVYDSAKNFIVEPLLANLERRGDGAIIAPDTSIWEERQKDKKHFAFTTAAAIAGLRAFDALAVRMRDSGEHARLQQVLALLSRGFAAAYIKDGSIRGTAEGYPKNDVDGAALAAIGLDIGVSSSVVAATAARMPALAAASGGFMRVLSDHNDPKIFEYWYERQEFVFTDFLLAEAYLRLGETQKAAALLRRITEKADADSGFVPELYVSLPCALFPGRVGDPSGAIPIVSYGAGEYVLHLLQRETLSQTPRK